MNPHLLRELWSLVESCQHHSLQTLDDNSLANWLTDQVTGSNTLNSNEADVLSRYIRSRLPLIRDLAQY